LSSWASGVENFRAGKPARFVAAHKAAAYMYGSEAADLDDEPQVRRIREVESHGRIAGR
jgi:hypothetical protein